MLESQTSKRTIRPFIVSSNRGLGLVELLVAMGAATLLLVMSLTIFQNYFKQTLVVEENFDEETDGRLFILNIERMKNLVLPSQIWLNTGVANYVGMPWITAQDRSFSIVWTQNMGLKVTNNSFNSLTPDPTGSDMVAFFMKDSQVSSTTLAASTRPDQAHLIPLGGTNFIARTAGNISDYQVGDIVGIQTPIGVQFGRVGQIGGNNMRLFTFGTYNVGMQVVNWPARYLPMGTVLFKVSIGFVGHDPVSNNLHVVEFKRPGSYRVMATGMPEGKMDLWVATNTPPSTPSIAPRLDGVFINMEWTRVTLNDTTRRETFQLVL